MTALWILAASASGPRSWMLPVALSACLAVQVAGWLAAERICKAVARRRRERKGGRA